MDQDIRLLITMGMDLGVRLPYWHIFVRNLNTRTVRPMRRYYVRYIIQLLKDFDSVHKQVGFTTTTPHVPLRRDGDNKTRREVDNLFTMLTVLDEHLAVDKLPIYVSDGPDKMPSTRLYEGDFSVLTKTLEKLENRLTNFGSALSAISRQVHALQARPTATGNSDQRGVIHTEVPPASVPNTDFRRRSDDWPELPVRAVDNSTQLAVTSRWNPGVPQVSDSVSVTHTNDDRPANAVIVHKLMWILVGQC